MRKKVSPKRVRISPFIISISSFFAILNFLKWKIKNITVIGKSALIDSIKIVGIELIIGPNTPSAIIYSPIFPWMFFCPEIMDINITARIGPALIVPTRPKEFSSAIFPPFILDNPSDIASTNGVVRAPVVAPEASKEIARNSSETKGAIIKIIP